MPKLKLTDKAIAKMPAPSLSGKQVLHWDTELRGFAVLCSGITNARTFVVQRDLPNGKTRRLTVAAVTELSLDKARDRAADMLDGLRRGVDPKVKVVAPTLRWSLDNYLAAMKRLRPASVRVYKQIERTLEPWMDLELREITSEMVEERHRAIAAAIGKNGTRYSGTSTANGAMRTLRILWNFAAERAELPPNPVRRLKRQWYDEPRRTRMVRAEDLPKFYDAVRSLKNAVARDYLLLLLFTGFRRGEAATLRWDDIDLTEHVIRLPAPRTKAGRKLDLPMSDLVRDLLVARRSLGNAGFVFPGPGASGHISDTGSPLSVIENAAGIKVSAHDLRRTFITIAESADISPLALKALVNHSLGNDVTAGYVQLTTERLRDPVDRVADKVKALCGIKPVGGKNVAKLVRK